MDDDGAIQSGHRFSEQEDEIEKVVLDTDY